MEEINSDEEILIAPEQREEEGQSEAGTAEANLRIVLVGKTGAGKSAAANTIIGGKVFKSTSSSSIVTLECQKETGEFEGQILAVVDTPGLFDPKLAEWQVVKEISRCISFAAPGPHVFLVVISVGRFKKDDEKTVKIIQKMFGEKAERYTMALFTRGDDLEEDGESIEQLISKNEALRGFIHQCGGGYHVFNNRAKGEAREDQIRELLDKINKMVQLNGGKWYTNDNFIKAEKAIQEKVERLQKKHPHMTAREARIKAERKNRFIKAVLASVGVNVAGAAVGAAVGVGIEFAAVGAVGVIAGPVGLAVGLVAASVASVAAAVRKDACKTQ